MTDLRECATCERFLKPEEFRKNASSYDRSCKWCRQRKGVIIQPWSVTPPRPLMDGLDIDAIHFNPRYVNKRKRKSK